MICGNYCKLLGIDTISHFTRIVWIYIFDTHGSFSMSCLSFGWQLMLLVLCCAVYAAIIVVCQTNHFRIMTQLRKFIKQFVVDRCNFKFPLACKVRIIRKFRMLLYNAYIVLMCQPHKRSKAGGRKKEKENTTEKHLSMFIDENQKHSHHKFRYDRFIKTMNNRNCLNGLFQIEPHGHFTTLLYEWTARCSLYQRRLCA